MKDEIEAGIKNALERGDSLEQAVKTFIAAGYNPVEVKEAANAISSGASSIVSSKTEIQASKSPISKLSAISMRQSSSQSVAPPIRQSQIIGDIQPKPTRTKRKIIITIVIILVVILLAILGVWLFGDNLLALFK